MQELTRLIDNKTFSMVHLVWLEEQNEVEMVGKTDPWFDSLYRKNAQKLFKVAYYVLKNHAIAEELVQDTFMVLLVQREKVEAYEHPEAYLMDVLRKRIGSELQKASRKWEEPLEEKHESIVAHENNRERVEDILPQWLNEQERQILLWRAEDGLSFREISLRLGCSEHACHARMYRLREKFKKFAEEDKMP